MKNPACIFFTLASFVDHGHYTMVTTKKTAGRPSHLNASVTVPPYSIFTAFAIPLRWAMELTPNEFNSSCKVMTPSNLLMSARLTTGKRSRSAAPIRSSAKSRACRSPLRRRCRRSTRSGKLPASWLAVLRPSPSGLHCARYTVLPAAIVHNTLVSRISSGEIVKTSRSNKTRSARLPAAMVPMESRFMARAEFRV